MTTTPDLDAAVEACRQLNLTGLAPGLDDLCQTAVRRKLTYPTFLAEALTIELDIRHERRRARRVQEARLPRIKTLDEFDTTANPAITPAVIGMLNSGDYIDRSEPVVLLGNSGTGKATYSSAPASPPPKPAGRSATPPARNSPTNWSKPKTTTTSPDSSPATAATTCWPSTNSPTSASTNAPPNCSSKSSPSGRNEPRSPSPRTPHSANGPRPSPIPASPPPSSTASPSEPTSSRPAPPATASPPARNPSANLPNQPKVGPDQIGNPGPIRIGVFQARPVAHACWVATWATEARSRSRCAPQT